MNDIFNINPKISTSLCALIGLILTDDLTANEQNVLGNWLMLISQTIITNAASQGLIQSRLTGNITNINSRENKNKYNPFIYDIETLKRILNQQNNDDLKQIIDKINYKINDIEKVLNELRTNY